MRLIADLIADVAFTVLIPVSVVMKTSVLKQWLCQPSSKTFTFQIPIMDSELDIESYMWF